MSEAQTQVGKPGRYQRSFSGMIGAMLVVVLVILAFVAFRGLVRDNRPTPVEPLPYGEILAGAADRGLVIAHLPELPEDWIATSFELRSDLWNLGMLTDEKRFVGIHQEGARIDQLVTTYVDEGATEGDPVRLDSPLAPEWRSFTDSGGDYALAAEVEDLGWVMVYGSAGADVIRQTAEDLVLSDG